jgi:hypothetical protein
VQQEFHAKSIFDELELVVEITTSSHMDKIQIRTKKDDAKYAKV